LCGCAAAVLGEGNEGRAGGAARGAGRRPPAGSGTLDAWVSSAGGVVLVGWCPGVCGRVHMYGWAFGLPEIFGSGSLGFTNFGFLKMIPEISWKKGEPENSGTRKFIFMPELCGFVGYSSFF